MVVYAPVASQVYKRNVEPGEYVSPGVPLVTLIDLGDMWIHFDLREDLVKTLKVGDRFGVRIPALGRPPHHCRGQADRHQGRICELARHPRHRRFRPADILDPRLSRRQGAGAAARHERVSGLAGARMRRPPKPGFLLVARREWRWLLHDRVALILIFGVPLFAFVVLTAVFSHPGDPRARGGRRRRRIDRRPRARSWSRSLRPRVSASSSAPATSRRRRARYAPARPSPPSTCRPISSAT